MLGNAVGSMPVRSLMLLALCGVALVLGAAAAKTAAADECSWSLDGCESCVDFRCEEANAGGIDGEQSVETNGGSTCNGECQEDIGCWGCWDINGCYYCQMFEV